MRITFIRYLFSFVLLLITTPLFAAVPPAFSAQVVQSGPAGTLKLGRIYVSQGFIRVEEEQPAGTLISLVETNKSTLTTLLPGRRLFSTRRGPYFLPSWIEFVFMNRFPQCPMLPSDHCRFQSTESILGRQSDKWEMFYPVAVRQTQWVDREHGFVIKRMSGNGGLMELRLTGLDTVEGRVVEKWHRTSSFRDEAPTISYQWYDPRLKLVIKEELPGGYVRRLSGLRIGEQPEHLFKVPQGYKSVNHPVRNL